MARKIATVLCFAALWAQAPAALGAEDRPYLATTSAAAEEDDDNVWALQSWFTRTPRANSLHAAAEYAFNPTTSVQIEWTRTREPGSANAQEVEFEFKHLFNHIARDGWGWGVSAALSMERSGSPWQRNAVSLTLPLSLRIGEHDGLVHLNAGVVKPTDAPKKWTAALGAERQVWPRTKLFGELARVGDGNLAHTGLRYWVRKDRASVDFAVMQRRADGKRSSGIVIGIGFNDL